MFPVRTAALLVITFALPAFSQNTSPDKNAQQKPVTQPEGVTSQPQTKVLVPENDAAAATSPLDSNDPLLSVPPLPKGKTTLVGGQIRNIDQIRNRMDV